MLLGQRRRPGGRGQVEAVGRPVEQHGQLLALEGAQATKDANLVALANARLEKYRAGQPWRE